jgi:aspartyl-tRNA(Asn)/glutamyl-tRNA(Gln) amidotransferase subunit B
MEIVSKPDMRSEEQAAYVKKLRTILRYLGTCDGDMEKGNLRADVNVSAVPPMRSSARPATSARAARSRTSTPIRFIGQAIEYEARRQIEIIEDGGKIDQETRLFDPNKGETRSMRSKEEAHDYRYFPDPDLLPLVLDPAWVKEIEATLPELPDAKKARLQSQYGLSAYDAGVLITEQARADFYEQAVKGRDPKLTSNWVTNDLAARLTAGGFDIEDSPIKPDGIAELVHLIEEDVISSKIAKDVFERMWAGEGRARDVVEKQGLQQVSDTGALDAIIDALIAANPGQAASVKEKPQAIGWFVGQVMKETGGKANPGVINQLLKAKLGL